MSIVGDDARQWRQRIDLACSEDPDFLEVWVDYWKGNYEFLKERCGELRSFLDRVPVILHGPFIWGSLIAPHPAVREYTLRETDATICLAAELEAPLVTLHGGALYAHQLLKHASSPEAVLAENLESLLPRARAMGVTLALENCPPVGGLPAGRVYPQTTRDLQKVVENSPEVRVTLDIGHALQNNEPPVRSFRSVLPWVVNIHLHDMNSAGVTHEELGRGVLDLEEFLKALIENHYGGYVTLEVSDPDETKARILRSFRLTRGLLANLSNRPSKSEQPKPNKNSS